MASAATAVWLGAGFWASADTFPDRPAVEIGDTQLSYRTLKQRAVAVADLLQRRRPEHAAIQQHACGTNGTALPFFAFLLDPVYPL